MQKKFIIIGFNPVLGKVTNDNLNKLMDTRAEAEAEVAARQVDLKPADGWRFDIHEIDIQDPMPE